MTHSIIGVDIGGTTVKIGVIDQDGNIRDKWEIPTDKTDQGAAIVTDIWESVCKKFEEVPGLKKSSIGIGIGAPGFIDSETGYVYEAVNIGWQNMDLANDLKSLSGLPVFAENDANIAALGENWKGSGNQAANLIAITLGTGVGGGVIANGSILNGANGTAGEIGHIMVDPNGYPCNCGRNGCLETVASATGMVNQAMDMMANNPKSTLVSFYRQHNSITAKEIFELAGSGDTMCKQIIQNTADVLGMAIANAAAVINPSKILIGGGVSQAGDEFIKLIDSAFRNDALSRVSDTCDIKQARLGNDAGIIGAAFLVKQKIEKVTF